MMSKNDENLKNKLDELENQIKSINVTLQLLLKNSERQTARREVGWLVLGVFFGGLLSISVNLWTEYYMTVVKPELNILNLIVVTIGMIATFVFLFWWAINRLRE